jgi:hypothetical protein
VVGGLEREKVSSLGVTRSRRSLISMAMMNVWSWKEWTHGGLDCQKHILDMSMWGLVHVNSCIIHTLITIALSSPCQVCLDKKIYSALTFSCMYLCSEYCQKWEPQIWSYLPSRTTCCFVTELYMLRRV